MAIKRFYIYLFFISVLAWSPCYGADPCMIKLDLNSTQNNDDANTQADFTGFTLANSGNEVNGVTIDISGDIQSCRRASPSGMWYEGMYYPRAGERIYRDFIYSDWPDGVTFTLWGLGINRTCNVTIWAFDDQSVGGNRIANWYANGTHILDTNFIGGSEYWPRYEYNHPEDLYMYAFSGTATTDAFGRIILTSSADPCSLAGQPFAFVNALVVEPEGAYIPSVYAQRPVPFDGQTGVSANVNFAWRKSDYAEKHDVYFGTDEAKVTDANRSNPQGVLVSQNQSATTYKPPKLLDLDTIYYWRVDEVNSAPDYTIFKGEVWSFATGQQFVMEDFDSYGDDGELRNVWNKGGTSGEVSVETTIVRDGNSMKYRYRNNLPPYYSETYVDMADLGIDDPNWSAIGAQALVLHFYGEPANPLGEQMYVKLTDGDSPAGSTTVMYGNMNDVRLKQWNEWSISLLEFADVNLANVARITIGFGDGGEGNAGVVYIEDIMLDYREAGEIPETSGSVNANTIYQELEGFGAAAGWHEWEIHLMQETERERLYDAVFNELGLDIYRVRNTYDYDSGYMANSAAIVTAGKQRNPSLKVLISSWSPPTYLKSTGRLDEGTLIGGPDDYDYEGFAQWWYDSIVAWANADYISIQNEPDYNGNDRCLFQPYETPAQAGYDQAFETVWQKLYSEMGSAMPKMIAPETAGFYGLNLYINALIDRNHVYGYAHHLYNGGGSYNNPDGYRYSMNYYRDNYGYKPLMQTEFAKGGNPGDVTTFAEAMYLAQLIHNSMVFENASAYLYWELFWTFPKGLVMYWGNSFIVNPVFYALKHYAAFTDPGWHRVAASTALGDLGSVRISAFKSPDNEQLSIVIINLATEAYNIMLNVDGFSLDSSEIYRTTETERTAYIGPFYEGNKLMLPARSIVTIHGSSAPLNCAGALELGYRLTSDIDPDCYVNYDDIKVMTDYWLNAECDLLDDCEGADFEPVDGDVDLADFGRFAEQWLWCNDPDDPDCTANWP